MESPTPQCVRIIPDRAEETNVQSPLRANADELTVELIGNEDLMSDETVKKDWLWKGYVARGMTTLLVSQWKIGKTTLLSVLLRKMQQNGTTFAGLDVVAAKAIVLSEEGRLFWKLRAEKQPFGPNLQLICRPFASNPTFNQWRGLIRTLIRLRREQCIDLFVIDSLATFLPANAENNASRLMRALAPLKKLTDTGAAVLLIHHPRKKRSAPGFLARGSGALTAHVDIIIEKDWGGPPCTGERKRILRGLSRVEETPEMLLIELNADGLDYTSLGTPEQREFYDASTILMTILTNTFRKLTIREILAEWPEESEKPCARTLLRWLTTLVKDHTVLSAGTGYRNDPRTYHLTTRTRELNLDPYQAALAYTEREFQAMLQKMNATCHGR